MKNPEFKTNLTVPETREMEPFNATSALTQAQRQMFNQAMLTPDGIAGLKDWRLISKRGREFKQAINFFEKMSTLDLSKRNNPSQAEALDLAFNNSACLGGEKPSRVQELLSCVKAKEFGKPTPPVRPEVGRIFNGLAKSKSTEGEVDVSELMSSSTVSFASKAEWFESRLASALDFLASRDLEDARQEAMEPLPEELMEQKQDNPEDNIPPLQSDTLTPSMDEMTPSKEKEPGAYFKIKPFYGGYYRGTHFDRWNEKTMKWEKSEKKFDPIQQEAIQGKSRRVVSGTIRPGAKTDLPMPYGFAPDITTLKTAGNEKIDITTDNQGNFVLDVPSASHLVTFSLEIGKSLEVKTGVAPVVSQPPTYSFSADTEKNLQEAIKNNKTHIDQARALKKYVRKTLTYSNDSQFNQIYRSGVPEEYFKRIEQYKQADCDVANSYFVALLWKANIQARLVAGHYVSSKSSDQTAVISSGTGHAWTEVWSGSKWQRLDATPPGDPNMDDKETDEQPDSESGEGDFGEQDAEVMSDEDLDKLMAEAEKVLAENNRQKPEELRALRFAEQAGCSPEEAKHILKKITETREKRDSRGRLIRSRLLTEWQKIIQDNLISKARYTAPVRMSRGQELVDPVEAVLDLKDGEGDPTGFSKFERTTEREQIYGGFDAFLVVDKSGSMTFTDLVSGRPKWEDQQVFTFLMMDSLYSVSQEFKRQKIRLVSPIDLRVALVSFSAGGAQIELPLGTAWGPKEQLQVWKALQENVGGGTPDHLGLQTVSKMIDKDNKENKFDKNRLRLVLVSADGGSDRAADTIAAKEELKASGVIVKAAGIGVGAREILSTYNPDGSNLASFADAPDWAANEVLEQAKKLYPRKVKK